MLKTSPGLWPILSRRNDVQQHICLACGWAFGTSTFPGGSEMYCSRACGTRWGTALLPKPVVKVVPPPRSPLSAKTAPISPPVTLLDTPAVAAVVRKPKPTARVARCGHEVAMHSGKPKRYCPPCVPIPAARQRESARPKVCTRCAEPFTSSDKAAGFCSRRCAQTKYAPVCTTPGCGKPHRAKGLCSSCYNTANYSSADRHAYPTRACETCQGDYRPFRREQRFCSLLCRSGGEFAMGGTTEVERKSWREAQRRRRATLRGVEVEQFNDRDIYERDGWRCQLCRAKVDQSLCWPHPMSASLDHIIPLTKPGTSHTRRNVRLAHLVCNTRRGNREGDEQLMLIG
jgi:HNH endonuclease